MVYYGQNRGAFSYTDHGTIYGVALGSSVRSWDENKLRTNFQQLHELGVTSIRFDIAWSALQPKDATHYNWRPYDQIISIANQYDIRSLVLLDYTPAWARQKSCSESEMCPPAENSQFASYAAAVVARYTPRGVSTYEIWNEENTNRFWMPTANAEAYGNLLHAASVAMRQENSKITILTGGLSPAGDPIEAIAPRLFIKQLYDLGHKDDFDGIALHPYTSPFVIGQPEAVNWSLMDMGDMNVRSIMMENNDTAKKIWVTEYGAATDGPGIGATTKVTTSNYDHVSESLQANMAKSALKNAATKPWLAGLYWYTLLDGSKSTVDRESHFGIIDANGKPKPAFYEMKKQLNEMKN